METILIVDDNKDLCFNLSAILKDEGYEVIAVSNGKQALKEVERKFPNLVLLDIRLPEMDGMKILEKMKKIDRDLIIIMLTAYGDIKDVVRAMKLGAFDYITKPFDNEGIVLSIKKALQTHYLSKEVKSLRKRLGEVLAVEQVMGESPQIKEVLKQIEIVAPTNMTVILQGESGAGKELIANMIHQKSRRKDGPFIAIDCGTIPETLVESELFGYEKGAFTGAEERKEGKFEQADRGTLFLDEITNLSEVIQMKLLRVIEERQLQRLGGKGFINIDVRIIVASNLNLSQAVRQDRLRGDLFYRLSQFQIDLPPLRERRDDIPVLAKCFLDEANQELNKEIKGISGQVMKSLLNYHWPGNVRELKNIIKRAVLLSDSNLIEPAHILFNETSLPKDSRLKPDLEEGSSLHEITRKATKEMERHIIEQALIKAEGNKSKAAKMLKIDRMTLYSKLKEFQLEKV